MDQPARPFTSEGTDARRWVGRIIVAVILGEAIWALIVSVMNNLIVPWLGDVMGQSSGLPTSFTQRPYNYPNLFVSILEVGIAGLVAAILNYFFQRPAVAKVRIVKSAVPAAPVGPIRVVPQAMTPTPPPAAASPITPAQVAKADSVLPPAPVIAAPAVAAPVIPALVVAAPAPPPAVAPAPVVRPVATVPPAPAAANPVAAKPQAPAAKVEPAKPNKAKEVYYNIVGEPMPSDDD